MSIRNKDKWLTKTLNAQRVTFYILRENFLESLLFSPLADYSVFPGCISEPRSWQKGSRLARAFLRIWGIGAEYILRARNLSSMGSERILSNLMLTIDWMLFSECEHFSAQAVRLWREGLWCECEHYDFCWFVRRLLSFGGTLYDKNIDSGTPSSINEWSVISSHLQIFSKK